MLDRINRLFGHVFARFCTDRRVFSIDIADENISKSGKVS
jgi:hypothetical protein